MDNVNRCVCCGATIPEGRQVCSICERDTNIFKKCKWIKVDGNYEHCKDCTSIGCPKKKVLVTSDPVNRPAHYTDGKIEVIEYIEDKKLGFCLGNAVKYISRAGKKDPAKEVEDLKKAKWYIDRRIKEIQEGTV